MSGFIMEKSKISGVWMVRVMAHSVSHRLCFDLRDVHLMQGNVSSWGERCLWKQVCYSLFIILKIFFILLFYSRRYFKQYSS